MGENVWEWMNDWHGSYKGSPTQNPTGPVNGQFRFLRGGSWNNNHPRNFRVAQRNNSHPDNSNNNVGFRGALSAPRTPEDGVNVDLLMKTICMKP